MYLTLIVAIVTSNYIFRCSKVSILIENIYISNQIIKLSKNSVCLLSWGKCLLMRSNILCKYLRNYESSSLTAAIPSKSFSNQQEWESLTKGSMSSPWIFCTYRTMIIKPINISNCCVKCAICQIYQYTR